MTLTAYIQQQTSLSDLSIKNTIQLINEDCTVPFISRYRKEMTGNLDEVEVSSIIKLKTQYEELEKRKEFILKTILEQEKLTPELEHKISNCFDEASLEDYYLPFKKKRKTRASIAREKGLEPLAKIIMKQNPIKDMEGLVSQYLNEEVENEVEAIEGVKDIIAEWINENEYVRHQLRKQFQLNATIESKLVKAKSEEVNAKKFSNYFDFKESLRRSPSHRLLAMLRGEKEGFLKVTIAIDRDSALDLLEEILLKTTQKWVTDTLKEAIEDAYVRLLTPSLSNEVLKEAKLQADKNSILVFANNLRQLLLAAPLGEQRILAIDPGYRSGCKLVCLDEKGDLLHNENIYPHAPQNQQKEAIKKIKSLINAYKIEVISIGNGTASRETESLVQRIHFDSPIKVFVVNEAGASIYSASAIAREEFPAHDVTVRGAVSIGRRLADPLAELVKIEAKSIGVGQYQHDVDQMLLKNELDEVVMLCVNKIGVNLNTASKSLLNYVSGIGEKMAENIINYRTENGMFESRSELKKVPRLGPKAFQQASAFLRIPNAKNPLDNSAVHPERYAIVNKMAKNLGVTTKELIQNKTLIAQIQPKDYITADIGLPTLEDILKELDKPGLDPRSKVNIFSFDPNLKKFDDLKVGMKVPGIINNITNFGCFVDIGLKESGLVHISKIREDFVSDINEAVHISQQVKVKVIEIDVDRKRIQLSMID